MLLENIALFHYIARKIRYRRYRKWQIQRKDEQNVQFRVSPSALTCTDFDVFCRRHIDSPRSRPCSCTRIDGAV